MHAWGCQVTQGRWTAFKLKPSELQLLLLLLFQGPGPILNTP